MAEPPPSSSSSSWLSRHITGNESPSELTTSRRDCGSAFSGGIMGFDYDFVSEPDERFRCAICLLVLRDPCQTPCGHLYCRCCILKWLSKGPHQRCPVDNVDISENSLFLDNFAKREIDNFQAFCPNNKEGCTVIVTVKQMTGHLQECLLALLPCPNKCSHVLRRQDLEEHVSSTCDKRQVVCQDCNLNHSAIDLESHRRVCPKVRISCPHCSEEMRREEIASHEDSLCPRKIICCTFFQLGCFQQMTRGELENHLRDNITEHLSLLGYAITVIVRHLGIQIPSAASLLVAQAEMTQAGRMEAVAAILPSLQQRVLGPTTPTVSSSSSFSPSSSSSNFHTPPTSLPTPSVHQPFPLSSPFPPPPPQSPNLLIPQPAPTTTTTTTTPTPTATPLPHPSVPSHHSGGTSSPGLISLEEAEEAPVLSYRSHPAERDPPGDFSPVSPVRNHDRCGGVSTTTSSSSSSSMTSSTSAFSPASFLENMFGESASSLTSCSVEKSWIGGGGVGRGGSGDNSSGGGGRRSSSSTWGSVSGEGSVVGGWGGEQKLVMHTQQLVELQGKVDMVERVVKEKLKHYDQQLAELPGQVCNGVFFWRIQPFSRYLQEAARGQSPAMHSPPFCTLPSGGYRLCLRANLHTLDSARGRHLSLFVHFMQGQYDDVVSWPFNGRIVLTVLDQSDNVLRRHHVQETLLAQPHLAAFQRPSTPRNHKGFGYMEFLPLSALQKSSFVKNDTLIVKVHVLPQCS